MFHHTDPTRVYLESYREAKYNCLRAKRKMLQLRDECTSTTRCMSDAIVAGDGDKRADNKLVAYAAAVERYHKMETAALLRMADVEAFVDRLPTQQMRFIFRARYVDLLSWAKILTLLQEFGMYYSERQVFNIHGRGLQAARKLWEAEHEDSHGENKNQ